MRAAQALLVRSLRIRSAPAALELINKLEPDMTAERRKELIMQFRDAVYAQQPDLPGC
jgi:hypothetical protein